MWHVGILWQELLVEFPGIGAQPALTHAPAKHGRQKQPYLPGGPRRPGQYPNCSPYPPDQPHI